jgi:TM2 domain-containing membrane protein YozV
LRKITFILLLIYSSKLLATNFVEKQNHRPNPFFISFKKKNNANKKAVAATLAFPLPFGVIGLHRIYLGTKPYVPLIYISTLGGAAGILPFIDFWVILCKKDISSYKENPHIFMWIEYQTKNETSANYD